MSTSAIDGTNSLAYSWFSDQTSGTSSKSISNKDFDTLISDIANTTTGKSSSSSTGATKSTTASASDNAKSYVSAKDKNGDGLLTSDEMGMSKTTFGKLDKNGDGTVDTAELDAGRSDPNVIQLMLQNMLSGNSTDSSSGFSGSGTSASSSSVSSESNNNVLSDLARLIAYANDAYASTQSSLTGVAQSSATALSTVA